MFLSPSSSPAQEQWFPIGPAAVQQGQTYGGGRIEVSGRATVLAVNPQNAQDVWLGTANGGVWHSNNAAQPGMSWRPMTDALPSLAIGALALTDCNDTRCETIYVGTGENNIRRDTYYGRGLYRIQWSGGEFPAYFVTEVGTTSTLFRYGAINDIVLDGTDIYVAVSEGRTSSGHQVTVVAPPPPSSYGVFHSPDGGVSWSEIGGTGDALPTDLELIDGQLYAGFMGLGIFRLNAAGDAWCPLNPGNSVPAGCSAVASLPAAGDFDHVELAAAPSDPDVIYAVFGQCPSVARSSCTPLLYRTTNGSDWEEVAFSSTGSYDMDTYSRYTHALAVHPINSDILYYGGLVINKSENGGDNFEVVGSGTTHPDHQDLVFADPADPELMYGVNDGGFYFSFDGGQCWNSGNYDLQITAFYSVDVNREAFPGTEVVPPLVFGGSQDNGTNLFNGTRVWQHVLDGDGGDCAMEDPLRMYASMQLKAPYRSTTGGALFSYDGYSTGIAGGEDVAFYPPYLQHSITKDLYFATERLYRTPSTGASAAWQPISPDFDASDTEYTPLETRNVISAVGLAPSDADRIYVGLYNGEIWRSNGAGPCADFSCWTQVGGPGDGDSGLPAAVVTSLAVDPGAPNTVYATYSGFNLPGDAHVYRTTAGGTGSWTPISSGLPDIPTHVIKIDPDASNTLWIGTDQGAFRSTTGGGSWETFGPDEGLPNTPVYDIAIDNFSGRVYAATHGRGMFMLTNQPVLYTFEGWMDGEIWDILVYGEGFKPSGAISSCTVDIILEDGTVCASGTDDSYSDTEVRIGAEGKLVTDRQFVWEERPVIAACLNGDCVGETDIEDCLDPANRIASVRVTCGAQVAFARISPDCPQQANPPSSVLEVEPPPPPPGFTCASAMSLEGLDLSGEGELDVLVTMATTSPANGGDRILCGTRVAYDQSDTPRAIAERIRDAINESTSCAEFQLEARVPPAGDPETFVEDFPPPSPAVFIEAEGLAGGQLILAIRTLPGQSTGRCFRLSNLGQYALNQLAIMRTTIVTEDGGAEGGTITFSESSALGHCRSTIPTSPGQTAEEIAAAIHDALMSMTEPGTLECEARQNPYDIQLDGTGLITIMANGITLCSTDPAVGFATGPDGLNLLDYEVDNLFEPRFAVSVHYGRTFPVSDFGSSLDPGNLIELDLEYQFAPHFGLEALIGRYTFDPSYQLTGGALYLKGYLTRKALRPFFAAGPGLYQPEDQNNLAFGLSLGAGLNLELTSWLQAEAAGYYYQVFKETPDASFPTGKVGLRVVF